MIPVMTLLLTSLGPHDPLITATKQAGENDLR